MQNSINKLYPILNNKRNIKKGGKPRQEIWQPMNNHKLYEKNTEFGRKMR